MSFVDRLQEAAARAGAGTSQAEIARALGVKRQTVYKWVRAGELPKGEMLLRIAREFGVDPGWLQTGEGSMLSAPTGSDLSQDERELIKNYRTATPQVRKVLATMARAVRKSVVVVALGIPPLFAQRSEAATLHNKNFADFSPKALTEYTLAIVRRACRALVRLMSRCAPLSDAAIA